MLFSLSRFGLLRLVFAAATLIATASLCQAADRVTKEQILKEWERTVIDPVTVEFTVEHFKQRGASSQKLAKDNDPFGGPLSDELDDSKIPTKTSSSWRLIRAKGKGMRLECIAPSSRRAVFVVHNGSGRYFSVAGSTDDPESGKTINWATRRDAERESITKELKVRLILDWLDPLATRNGQRFSALPTNEFKLNQAGDTVSVTVADGRTITLSSKHNWRSVRERSVGSSSSVEMIYAWEQGGDLPLFLKQAEDTYNGGPGGKFSRTVVKVDRVSQDPIPDSAFELEYPPGTVISDSVSNSDETTFLVSYDGVERHFSGKERAWGRLQGEGWVEALSRNSPPAQLQQSGTRYVFWGVMITVICVGLVFLARKVRYAYR